LLPSSFFDSFISREWSSSSSLYFTCIAFSTTTFVLYRTFIPNLTRSSILPKLKKLRFVYHRLFLIIRKYYADLNFAMSYQGTSWTCERLFQPRLKQAPLPPWLRPGITSRPVNCQTVSGGRQFAKYIYTRASPGKFLDLINYLSTFSKFDGLTLFRLGILSPLHLEADITMFTAKRCLFVSACLASCQIDALAFNPLAYQRSTALCSTVLRGEIPVKTEIDISEDFFVCLRIFAWPAQSMPISIQMRQVPSSWCMDGRVCGVHGLNRSKNLRCVLGSDRSNYYFFCFGRTRK
jgi:hypothetical protein